MRLTFLGATKTVTGSKYLLEIGNRKILIDCGLFQGEKELRLRNWTPFPISPQSIDAVLLTHAHIDHTGYLPLLIKNGFKGSVYASQATYDLCKILLPDSGYIQEEEARRANKYHYSKHSPALPLYTQRDAELALERFVPIEFDTPYSLFHNFIAQWHRAGHILGASFIRCISNGTHIVFSGDIGRLNDPVMKAPTPIRHTDYLILESTYGNRLHDPSNPQDKMAGIINDTIKKGGSIIIPAFAVGRTQALLYHLFILKKEHKIPNVPIYLDSPMAISATKLLQHHQKEHKLTPDQCYESSHIATYVNTPEDSKEIALNPASKIIIASSGMATGGRVLHHLKTFAPHPWNTILLSGFQATGTRGAALLAGAKELKIYGEMIPIRARIENIDNLSAHADSSEILTWLSYFSTPPQKTFITHGEPDASKSLKEQIESKLGWHCYIPSYSEKVDL